jgi:copper chaperone CopZ
MAITSQRTSEFNNFEIINLYKCEVQVKAPRLYHDPHRAKILEVLLRKQDAIISVQITSDLASVAIQFDPVKLPQKSLFLLLDTLLDNIGNKVSKTFQKINPYRSAETIEQEVVLKLKINGMSCECCALSLEMNLKKEAEIQTVAVDFASATAIISGNISNHDAVKKIKSHGYSASVASV